MEWKWTDGKPYERTRRMKHQIKMENENFSKEQEKSAYTSSLNHDENTWEILNQNLSETGFKVSNKRECKSLIYLTKIYKSKKSIRWLYR